MKKNKETNLKRQIVIFSLIAVLLIAVVALIYNISALAVGNSRERALQQRLVELNQIANANNNEIDFRTSPEFIEQYAREHLELQNPNDVIFIGR